MYVRTVSYQLYFVVHEVLNDSKNKDLYTDLLKSISNILICKLTIL